jgi:hypothetical protein
VGVKKDTTAGAGGIVVDVDRLFEAQETSWADLARGLDGLRRARERTFDIGGFPIVARHLPHRIGIGRCRRRLRAAVLPVPGEPAGGAEGDIGGPRFRDLLQPVSHSRATRDHRLP